jgi:6,7-dimethyl-8-ribityllumazine synthase
VPEIQAPTSGAGLRVGIVVARWNSFITQKLLDGAVSAMQSDGVRPDDITVAWVPGSFEIPTAARWAAGSGRFDAVICIGAVIRGETAHFEYVAGAAADGVLQISLETGVPVIFGLLTVENVQQALERVGGKEGHKGEEAGRAAIEMANLRKLLA